MATIGVGVIGCGEIARVRYFRSIAALPELELVAVLSRNAASRKPIAAGRDVVGYTDLEAFLADPRIDAVVVATPHPSHAGLSIRALAAGKHVLTEKPMATSLADAARLREAAERSGRVFMALPFDDLPPMVEARRLVASGTIGHVSSADAVLAHHGPLHARWFFDQEKAAWGVLADLGIYLISQLTFLFGAARAVTGQVVTVFPERSFHDGTTVAVTVEDSVVAVVAWPDDTLASIRTNWCSAADIRNFIWDVRLYGTTGAIRIDMAIPEAPLLVYAPGRDIEGADKLVRDGIAGWHKPRLPPWDHHATIVRAFADAIFSGAPNPERGSNVARQHHVIEIIAKLYEAAKAGRTMNLDVRY